MESWNQLPEILPSWLFTLNTVARDWELPYCAKWSG